MSKHPELDWLLKDLLDGVPETRHAVVLSGDGILLSRSPGIERDDAERLAAAASGLQSLSHGVAREFAGSGSGAVRQAMVEFDGGFLFVVAAGAGAHLAVLAGSAVDAGLVAHRMHLMVTRIGEHLNSPPRTVGGGGPAA